MNNMALGNYYKSEIANSDNELSMLINCDNFNNDFR